MQGLFLILKPGLIPHPPTPFLYIEGDHPQSLNAKNPDDFLARLRVFLDNMDHLRFLDHIHFVENLNLSPADQQKMELYKQATGKVISLIKSSLGSFSDSLLGIKNLFGNIDIAIEKPGINHLKISHPFDGVVVSAGPSLDLEFETLRKLRDSHIIICVDAALKTLLHEGIVPHMVTVVERDDYSIPFFDHLPRDLSTCLVGHTLIDRKIFNTYPGPIATAVKYTGPSLWIPIERSRFWTGSSSAHVAYRTIASLGARRIALVGQDLCFHPDTFQSHTNVPDYPAWSQPSTLDKRRQESSILEVKGNTREKVYSKPTWLMFANDFQIIFDETKIPTVNTSKYGIEIPGCRFQPLNEWLREHHKENQHKVSCKAPDRNPNLELEKAQLLAKRNDAVKSLTLLRKRINTEDDLEKLYRDIPTTAHFLELCLELVFREWVDIENQLISVDEVDHEKRRALFKHFVSESARAIDEVLQALSFKI